MNSDSRKDLFLRYIENTRGCDPARLNAAVSRGLRKAKNDRLDAGKFALLAAACVCTALMCFSVNLRPFTSAVEKYYRNQIEIMPGSGEALERYFRDIANNAKQYLGGE